MSDHYQYVKINRPYFCLQQNPIALAWLLFFKNESLRLHSLGLDRRKALYVVKTFLQHQLHLRDNVPALELPVYGNLCLPVHRGYKTFNFRLKTVARVFSPETDPATVMREIEGVRNASQLDFAPRLRRWNARERWYEEDFVIGYRACLISKSEPSTLLETYYRYIAPCIERMILLQAPLTANLNDYVNGATDILQDVRLSEPGLDPNTVATIKNFVESMVRRLSSEGNRQIDLVFSHGDFSLVNILRTKDGIMAIDWESASHRSTLFDLYNYFFTELYYRRTKTNLVSEINEAISVLQSRLASRAPNIARSLLSQARMYRWLYYFERVHMLLKRELNNHLLDVVLRSIEVFNRYEQAAAVNCTSGCEGGAWQK